MLAFIATMNGWAGSKQQFKELVGTEKRREKVVQLRELHRAIIYMSGVSGAF